MNLSALVRTVPDFPKPGIGFRDITPLLASPEGLGTVIDRIAHAYAGARIDAIAAIESRGFLFGAPLALRLGAGCVPLRKPGKLPAATYAEAYDLEYGSAELEMHVDGLAPGDRVLLVDDVLATGGTLAAAAKLVRRARAKIAGAAVVIELDGLDGRARLQDFDVLALLRMDA